MSPPERVIVRSTKFDGRLHYRWEGDIVESRADLLTIYTPPGTPSESYRGPLCSTSHRLAFFWPDRPWNLHLRWLPNWELEDYYVNIATRPAWSQVAGQPLTVDWVDLDLDLILKPGSTEPFLDDVDEFSSHSRTWNYPDGLVSECWQTVETVRLLMRQRQWPFDESHQKWAADLCGRDCSSKVPRRG